METIYQDISIRTGGDIYIGVVGPVRSGKSTLINRFMETILLPSIDDPLARIRARDEQPQSAAGRTIMTTEPKFVPEAGVQIDLEDGGTFRARLIDCVGYMVDGAMGYEENDRPRMVKSPWFQEEVPFDLAAEIGTRKVIAEHSTIGIVVTTDGTISDIARENYLPAERRVIKELNELGKPYVILLNSIRPDSSAVAQLAKQMEQQYNHTVIPVSCIDLDAPQIETILRQVLYEFPVRQLDFVMPRWITALEPEHWLQRAVYDAALNCAEQISYMKDVSDSVPFQCDGVHKATVSMLDLASGKIKINVEMTPNLFYAVLGEQTNLEIHDEASLMPYIISLTKAKREYEKLRSAMEQVEATGYGIVMPSVDELQLQEPEIVKQGGRYGVKLKACAPSIHMMKAVIHTEINPIVGSERQSEELVRSLLSDFEDDPIKIWQSNIFGKSLHELVSEGLQGKLVHMPHEARLRLQETLERVINEGCSGLICIIL